MHEDAPRLALTQRIESSPAGQAVLSVLAAAIVASIVVWNLPASELRATLDGPASAILEPAGLDQNWGVFAPDPRRIVVSLYARIEYADGSTRTWTPPAHAAGLGAYREYRWQKWVEHARADATSGLWKPAARWIADTQSHGKRVVRVTLVRKFRDIIEPGKRGRGPDNEYEYYVLDLDAREPDETGAQ